MTDTSQVTARLAVESDIPAVMQLEQRTDNAAHWTEAQYQQIFQGGPRRVMLLVEEANRLRGFLVASSIGNDWEIENVVVDDSARRRGFGRILLQQLIAQAHAQHAESIHLEVRESNDSARALYKKCAFVETGRRKSYFRNPSEDAILYRLSLPQNA
jgi:[ribosomal protein S18]-alanine N-acetyltransferase